LVPPIIMALPVPYLLWH
jgi:hypothetical protein